MRWYGTRAGCLSLLYLCSFFTVGVNECMSMLSVACDRLRNTLQCLCPIEEISHDNGFIFQSLVILTEAFDLKHTMWRQFKNRVVVRIIGIVDVHRNDLIINPALVPHLHQPYRFGRQDRQRHDGLLTKHQHIQRIVIFGVGLWDETIVRRIMDGAEEHTINANKPGSLIEFILIL